ncbi:DUF1127 domain-containing protein [Antarcticirhabdus aurantiaca]|uniref:DUF1127 domain-containing protein n=1 Tax=Antarcticirhabdus aurantiaca TaxID=2606717 RepID=A0ACD4NNQ8_9HYPH|nr:DUF1127 domain-containing protein [Antarcticirhabdus aurantiaca]WAJ28542.1 DUF1127 domain-containing protein [Jeongeuplla avenae]
MIRTALRAAARRRRAHATFRALDQLDAVLLDDIGLTRQDVEQLRPARLGRGLSRFR